ncbi:MAG: hypothetical protein KC438_16295, partial [Thermomicrobiales bacterium]|nr:hypothetical protein [Thermomicrobiales bacterium]
MLTNPYIHVSKSSGGHIAFFTIVLSDIAKATVDAKGHADVANFAQTVLNQQTDFIATLAGLGNGAALEV